MFLHYLTVACKNFWRFRFATLVNVLCLSLGLACFVMTYSVMAYLTGSDRSFPKADRVQIVAANLDAPAANLKFDAFPQTGPIVARYLETDFPQLEAVARRTPDSQEAVSTGESSAYALVSYADPKLLDIFDFTFLAGSGSAALEAPNTALVTESAALRIFGSRDVVGRSLRIANQQDVTITAVIARIPEPTRFQFELLVSMNVLEAMQLAKGVPEPTASNFVDWWWLRGAYITYALLPVDGTLTPAIFDSQLKTFALRHVLRQEGGNTLDFSAIPLSSILLQMINGQLGAFARINLSVTFLGYLLAAVVLFIACLNYANLASALASVRGKEIGLRKVVGASRTNVLAQHLLEATLIGCAALALVVSLVALLVPMIRRMGFDIATDVLLQPGFAGFVLLLLVFVTVAGGIYPAFVLSAIRPVQALRTGPIKAGRRFIPSALVFLQFGMSGFLLITVMIIQSQNRLVLNPGRTLTIDPVVVLNSRLDVAKIDMDILRVRLLDSPFIKSVTSTAVMPMSMTAEPLVISPSADPQVKPTTSSIVNVSYDFFSTMDMALLAGRDFDRARGADLSAPQWEADKLKHILVDAAFTQQMGWAYGEAVGKNVYLRFGPKAFPMEVIGVVNDRPMHLLGMGTNSNIYFLSNLASIPSVRISKENIPAALAHIDRVWKELSPNVPLRREFLDSLMQQTYRYLLVISTLFTGLATFGLVIAGMGLFGMAVYMTDRRVHEIGVRKSLGATTGKVLRMLFRDFSKPVVVASILAWPLAYLVGRTYLNMFVERAPLNVVPFLTGLVITVLVAWLAIVKRAFGAARITPASVLRYE